MAQMTDKDWQELKEKLAADGRFEKFILGESEQEYVSSRGMDILRLHATDFVNKRLAPANPKNDGRQTPTKGHPVFIAQHACGCNDRASLAQFYHIEKGRALTPEEVELIVNVVLTWIEENIEI
ncbi:MAG: DUF4186 family protein [Pontiellaceae bacterium]|nr:DUF4186 family protein [Pontiellaceae bacterium]